LFGGIPDGLAAVRNPYRSGALGPPRRPGVWDRRNVFHRLRHSADFGHACGCGDPRIARALPAWRPRRPADDRLAFEGGTEVLQAVDEATLSFAIGGENGLRIEGGGDAMLWSFDTRAVRDERRERDFDRWSVRRADTLTPDAFAERYVNEDVERHPIAGRWGRWLDRLGRWDW
jgi:hypothetical protein